MKNLTLLLLGLVVLAFTTACTEQAPSASTASAPAHQSTPSSDPDNSDFAPGASTAEVKQIDRPTDPTPRASNDDSDSSESVRVFPVEDVLPAEPNMKPATQSEDTLPAYRAPEESEEITPVNVRSTHTY